MRGLALPANLVVTSGEWGIAKPDPGFFRRVLEVAQAAPDDILHVGDHPANDVFPAKAAGLRAAHIRRGPWGCLWADSRGVVAAADWRIDSLTELADIVRSWQQGSASPGWSRWGGFVCPQRVGVDNVRSGCAELE